MAAVFLSLFSCGRRESRVIPRDRLSAIYAEMFITDQWINAHPESRRTADTTLVYEPIFERYGYTADDYRRSMDYYLSDPDKYARILRETSVIIEDRLRELRKEKEMLDAISRLRSGEDIYRPERIYYLTGLKNPDLAVLDSISFFVDSTGGRFDFNPQTGYDTVYAGPVFVTATDSVHVADTSGSAQAAGTVKDGPEVKKSPRTAAGPESVQAKGPEVSKALISAEPVFRHELDKQEN